MTTTITTADEISERLDEDGMQFEDGTGIELDELAAELGGGHGLRINTADSSEYRYEFDDGSVITVNGAAWDHGYIGCQCWRGTGHDDRRDGCEARDDSDR